MQKIKKLIEFFDDNKNEIKSNWNETETRIELINPLFECLGWDVNNTQKLATPFKEVKHEASLKIGSNIKAPDYSFNYGKPLFYLEAKKPSVDIKHDISPSYQLRRYGWTAKMPISILTDFEELAIYDCRIKPAKNDNAGVARLKYYTYKDYIEKWDEIYNLISKEAILHGSLNDFENKQIKGTASVDDDFLNTIEEWRKSLALNIALRNPDLKENELNYSIQRIIDRIIFLRICEDRGIENYALLKNAINDNNCYEKLLSIFKSADDKYNSGLFHFKKEKNRNELPDKITPNLTIDDKVLKSIIKSLYYPDCPYELSVISSDVLGSVYERFLGKVISLTAGHSAKIDFKPEVRKAGGVYYTPDYIVKYIVENTIGKKLKACKNPEDVSKLKILDPACGSGSFIIEAYQYLLNWHLEYYSQNDTDKHKNGKNPKIFESSTGLHLTLAERKRILLNNIFGVDIDKNAVEVTKLSLLLKVLEYEGQEIAQWEMFKERVLPDLYNNVKCGNSLIGTDILTGYLDIDIIDIQKINPFDWHNEFKEIMDNGGFDCVIGNPPYVLVFDIELKKYLENKYNEFKRNNDLYVAFIPQGLRLLKKQGYFSLITPNSYILGEYFIELRNLLIKYQIKEIINFEMKQIFKNVNVYTAIFTLLNTDKISNWTLKNDTDKKIGTIKAKSIDFKYRSPLIEKLENLKTFNDFFQIKDVGYNYWSIGRGKVRGDSIGSRILYSNEIKKNDDDIPFFKGSNIFKYYNTTPDNFLKYNYKKYLKENDIFRFSSEILETKPKIIYRQTANKLIGTIDYKGYHNDKTIHVIIRQNGIEYDLHFVLGLFNSKLLTYFYKYLINETGRAFPQVKTVNVKKLPFPNIEINDTSYTNIIKLVNLMLDLQKKYHSTNTDHEKKLYEKQIEQVDNQIDKLVYDLYELNEDDIKIIEDSLK